MQPHQAIADAVRDFLEAIDALREQRKYKNPSVCLDYEQDVFKSAERLHEVSRSTDEKGMDRDRAAAVRNLRTQFKRLVGNRPGGWGLYGWIDRGDGTPREGPDLVRPTYGDFRYEPFALGSVHEETIGKMLELAEKLEPIVYSLPPGVSQGEWDQGHAENAAFLRQRVEKLRRAVEELEHKALVESNWEKRTELHKRLEDHRRQVALFETTLASCSPADVHMPDRAATTTPAAEDADLRSLDDLPSEEPSAVLGDSDPAEVLTASPTGAPRPIEFPFTKLPDGSFVPVILGDSREVPAKVWKSDGIDEVILTEEQFEILGVLRKRLVDQAGLVGIEKLKAETTSQDPAKAIARMRKHEVLNRVINPSPGRGRGEGYKMLSLTLP
jgi:hypothetical protein